MSIVLVCFSNAPKVSDEAVKKDAELDKYLESRVEGKESVLFIRNAVVTFLSMKTKTLKGMMPLYVGSNSGLVTTLNFCVSGKMFLSHVVNLSWYSTSVSLMWALGFYFYLYRSKCNHWPCRVLYQLSKLWYC